MMKLLIKKTKLITILLTFINIGLCASLLFFHQPLLSSFIFCFITELIIVVLYVLIITYRWVNDELKNIQTDFQNKLTKTHDLLDRVNHEQKLSLEQLYSELQKSNNDLFVLISEKNQSLSLQMDNVLQQNNDHLIFLHDNLKREIEQKSKETTKEIENQTEIIIEKINQFLDYSSSVEKMLLKNFFDVIKKINNQLNSSNFLTKIIIELESKITFNRVLFLEKLDTQKTVLQMVLHETLEEHKSETHEYLTTYYTEIIDQFTISQNLNKSLVDKLQEIKIHSHKNTEQVNKFTQQVAYNQNEIIISTLDQHLQKLKEYISDNQSKSSLDIVNTHFQKIIEHYTELSEKINNGKLQGIEILRLIDDYKMNIIKLADDINNKFDKHSMTNTNIEENIKNALNFSNQELTKSFIKSQDLILDKINLNTDKKTKEISTSLNHRLVTGFSNTYDRIDALLSIHNLIDLNAPLPIMHDWRISSDYAHEVLTTLLEKKKGNVLDIGSGVSTILWGYGVKKNNHGKVIALEHSKEYFLLTKKLIKTHSLENFCEVHYCPLINYNINGNEWLWYDISKINFPNDISIISIDGPPGDTQYLARYPAYPILKKYFNDKTTIFLDDGNRPEEIEIVNNWINEYKLSKFQSVNYKGYFKLTSNDSKQ